jgi:hypothetical protein
MVRQRGHLDAELFEPYDTLPQDLPRNVREAEDLEPHGRRHAAFWHGPPALDDAKVSGPASSRPVDSTP